MREQRSAAAQQYRRWYWTARWRELRQAQLRLMPNCSLCAKSGRLTTATVVDHYKPHRGDEGLFFDTLNLVSLCKPHHDATKARFERGRLQVLVKIDGWPGM